MAPSSSDTEVSSSNPRHASLAAAKRNISYLLDPKKHPKDAPGSFRTRAFLRTTRYLAVFIFWRLVRWAKYALVGSAVAAIAGTAIGSVASGAAFAIAPTGIVGGAGAGLLWGLGRFGWRRLAKRVGTGKVNGKSARMDERADAGKVERADRRAEPREMEPW